MKFILVDRIESIEPGSKIVAVKALSLAEEYLADHFPAFPVLPGVMMLEALTQSAAWLVRLKQNYAKSVIILSAARNVRYANFVSPGRMLRCELEAVEIGDSSAKFKGVGLVDGKSALNARLELRCFNLAETNPSLADADAAIVAQLKQRFVIVGGPAAMNSGQGSVNSGQ
jgi:3-hydroxyacyl-[acyl-carrier-protein] dehydratase